MSCDVARTDLTQGRCLSRACFFLSWWAYSFPLAALSIASLVMYDSVGGAVLRGLPVGWLVLVTVIVCGCVARTFVAVARHEICLPE